MLRVAFVPAADVEIEDTWYSGGLRGTGSHHVVVRDLAVDPDQCSVFGGDRWAGGQLWRIPILCTFLPLLAAVPLGLARGALDEVAHQVREGRAAQRGPLAEDPVGLAELATADARLRAADAGLRAVLGEAHDAAEQHRPVLPALQARVCLVAQEATDAAVEATAAAHRLGGGAAAYRDSPLLRALEDVHAARQHQLFAHKHRSELARALAGLDVRYPPFVVDPR
jgi:indole-3-acetate monooxygenase